MAQRQGRRRIGYGSGVIPNDVQQDVLKRGIAVVTVGAPAAGAQVNLHIAGTRRGVANLNDRAAKIRPAFDADETGMQNPNGSAVGRLEPVALQPLMTPDGLEQAFRRRGIFVAQDVQPVCARAPVGVKIIGRQRHCGLLLRLCLSKVKPARIILNAANTVLAVNRSRSFWRRNFCWPESVISC